MHQTIRKVVSLNDIKYSWILLISSILFGILNYMDRLYADDPVWIHVGYWLSFALAVLWGALNYIGHIRMNAMYKQQSSLQEYVNQLAMSDDEKEELQAYLEDYVQDLMVQGMTKTDATREAINQFKVKEILSLSKNTMFFNLHAHYYLIGWTIVSILGLITVWLLGMLVIPYPSFILTMESIFIAYAIGICGMFFLYKLIDVTIYRKLKKLFWNEHE